MVGAEGFDLLYVTISRQRRGLEPLLLTGQRNTRWTNIEIGRLLGKGFQHRAHITNYKTDTQYTIQIKKIVWKDKKERLKRRVWIKSKEEGGLKVLSFKFIEDSVKLKCFTNI